MIQKTPTANERLLDNAIQHAIHLERFKAGEVQRIMNLLGREVIPDLLAKAQRELERIRLRGPSAAALGTRRYKDMVAALEEILREGVRVLRQDQSASLFDIARHEAAWQARTLSAATGPLQLEFTLPDAGLLRSIVTARPMQGHLIRDWWAGIAQETKKRVTAAINVGLVEGEDVDAIVRRLRGTREARFRDGVLEQTRRNVESVVRTAVNHVTSHARQETYRANDDLVKGVKWVSVLDLRTTAICRDRDGQVYPIDSGPRPPAHWGCRSTTTPVLKSWKELGINLKDAPPGTRASMDGQVPATETYYEWLARQSVARQDAVLGPARAAMFRRGKLDPSRFLDSNDRPLTLAELEALEARAA